MLEYKDALIGAQHHTTVIHRDCQVSLSQGTFDVSRHIVGPLGDMTIKAQFLGNELHQEVFDIPHNVGVNVLLDQ